MRPGSTSWQRWWRPETTQTLAFLKLRRSWAMSRSPVRKPMAAIDTMPTMITVSNRAWGSASNDGQALVSAVISAESALFCW